MFCQTFPAWSLLLVTLTCSGGLLASVGVCEEVQLIRTEKPKGFPDAWDHPQDTSLLDGKCGLTAVSNLLRLYGIEVDPKDIDQAKYRSWGPGLRRDKFAEDMNVLAEGKGFESKCIEEGVDALGVVESYLADGKPFAIMYMTNKKSPSVEAHWVVVVAILPSEEPKNPKLIVQSWGEYHEVEWNEIAGSWKRGYGGDYPHVVGDSSSPYLKKQ
ncbi:MAG: hypothetical protein JNK90_17115 [Planctomycetaceae bacterium]|nr:hypothetical protein [Planctomycetaceae bacterium]